jgi:acyl-CoA thioester hydrolase
MDHERDTEGPTRFGTDPYMLTIPTRWSDNDVYAHVNNAHYYAFFDTVINSFLATEGGLDPQKSAAVGLCRASQCEFLAPVVFPGVVHAGLRVMQIGNSSVRYGLRLYDDGRDPVATSLTPSASSAWIRFAARLR